MLTDIFKENLHKYGEITPYIEKALVKELDKIDLDLIPKDKLSDSAKKISYFINLDKDIDVKVISIRKEIIPNRTYEFEPADMQEFMEYYNYVKKDDLLIVDKDNVLKLKNQNIFISQYRKSDKINEYFNFLLYQFNKNLDAMKLHILTERPTHICGFYGYTHLVNTLVNDVHFFER